MKAWFLKVSYFSIATNLGWFLKGGVSYNPTMTVREAREGVVQSANKVEELICVTASYMMWSSGRRCGAEWRDWLRRRSLPNFLYQDIIQDYSETSIQASGWMCTQKRTFLQLSTPPSP
eukprot:scaffold8921_cov137-Isochrysis_galbana.AAC.5